jgi:hypothetical protein
MFSVYDLGNYNSDDCQSNTELLLRYGRRLASWTRSCQGTSYNLLTTKASSRQVLVLCIWRHLLRDDCCVAVTQQIDLDAVQAKSLQQQRTIDEWIVEHWPRWIMKFPQILYLIRCGILFLFDYCVTSSYILSNRLHHAAWCCLCEPGNNCVTLQSLMRRCIWRGNTCVPQAQ